MKKEKDENMDKLVDEIIKEMNEEMKNGMFKSTESEKNELIMRFICVLVILYILCVFYFLSKN